MDTLKATARALLTGARDYLRSMSSESPSASEEPWTIHDSNVALHECLSKRNTPIPNEIILQILDDSTRWIRTKVASRDASEGRVCVGSNLRNRGEERILSTSRLSSLEAARIRRVVFTFRSSDQGWSGEPHNHGTFHGSWTWMEASLVSPDRAIHFEQGGESARYELQKNRHAGREPENYRCELGPDHGLLQEVRGGDSVTLVARAKYPAWENRVYEAGIEVWCMDDLMDLSESTA